MDNRFDDGVFLSILSEITVVVALIEALDLQVSYVADLLNTGVIRLRDELAYRLTASATFGVMTAFNMLDDIDGLGAYAVVRTILMCSTYSPQPRQNPRASPCDLVAKAHQRRGQNKTESSELLGSSFTNLSDELSADYTGKLLPVKLLNFLW